MPITEIGQRSLRRFPTSLSLSVPVEHVECIILSSSFLQRHKIDIYTILLVSYCISIYRCIVDQSIVQCSFENNDGERRWSLIIYYIEKQQDHSGCAELVFFFFFVSFFAGLLIAKTSPTFNRHHCFNHQNSKSGTKHHMQNKCFFKQTTKRA